MVTNVQIVQKMTIINQCKMAHANAMQDLKKKKINHAKFVTLITLELNVISNANGLTKEVMLLTEEKLRNSQNVNAKKNSSLPIVVTNVEQERTKKRKLNQKMANVYVMMVISTINLENVPIHAQIQTQHGKQMLANAMTIII
jgi:hypothetical protein